MRGASLFFSTPRGVPFNPNNEKIIEQQLEGIAHYSTVSFALKERYKPEVRLALGTLRLVNAVANPNFVAPADILKQWSKSKTWSYLLSRS